MKDLFLLKWQEPVNTKQEYTKLISKYVNSKQFFSALRDLLREIEMWPQNLGGGRSVPSPPHTHTIQQITLRSAQTISYIKRVRLKGLFVERASTPVRGQFKCDGTHAETWFRLTAKRTSPFKSAGGRQFSRLLAAEVCAISGSNAGYTMFRGSVKSTGYSLHSPVSPSLTLPCVTVCHHISTGLYVH